jgi:hypothetical protein
VQKCRSGVAGWGVSFERGFLRSVCVCVRKRRKEGRGPFLQGEGAKMSGTLDPLIALRVIYEPW